MKLLIIALILIIKFESLADSFFGAEFLTHEQAKKKWSELEFYPSKFKLGTEKEKGAMAVYALKVSSFVGKDMLQVRKEMGTPDSYFFSDTIFAYQITQPEKNKESWHLIFIPDEKLEKVKEIKIHKKCCYISPF